MKFAILSALCCLAVTGSADAQTTTCNQFGTSTYCNTTPASPPIDLNAIMENHRKAENQRIERIVGQMVLNGQCSDAKATALNNGDLQLAQEVDATCHPAH